MFCSHRPILLLIGLFGCIVSLSCTKTHDWNATFNEAGMVNVQKLDSTTKVSLAYSTPNQFLNGRGGWTVSWPRERINANTRGIPPVWLRFNAFSTAWTSVADNVSASIHAKSREVRTSTIAVGTPAARIAGKLSCFRCWSSKVFSIVSRLTPNRGLTWRIVFLRTWPKSVPLRSRR